MILITNSDRLEILKKQARTYYILYLVTDRLNYFYKAYDLLCWCRVMRSCQDDTTKLINTLDNNYGKVIWKKVG